MKHRILIADDDESGRSGLAALLTMWGYEVQEAVDGKDALERAPAFRPSVVIADMIMPVVDGIGLLKPLATALPETAVILLTAHGSIETAVSAMRFEKPHSLSYQDITRTSVPLMTLVWSM